MVYQGRRKRRGDDDDDDEEKDDNDTAAREENRRETQVSSGQMAKNERARISPTAAAATPRRKKEEGRGGSLTYGARSRERRSAGLLLPLPLPPRAPLPPRSFDRRRRPRRSLLAALEISVIKHRRKEERGEGPRSPRRTYAAVCLCKCQNTARVVSFARRRRVLTQCAASPSRRRRLCRQMRQLGAAAARPRH